ncbi:hypothetical protein [uncultured Gammaproteobacteria bacterium]|nr:hypothetical protein [uncultured Gammaproteobacteria bacterium]CAC9952177.1 hypothetical protein [uncultured Gammaproteobacteria bacterium]
MSTAVRISDELASNAKKYSKVEHRSVTGQVEYWARIGKCAVDNPDLSYEFIKDLLVSIEELDSGEKSEFKFG